MKHFIVFILTLLIVNESAYAQNKDSIQLLIANQAILFPQEKVYLQTDKSCYVTGEKLWFRAHLVDEILNTPSTLSSYVFVELINPLDSVINRFRIKSFDGAFYGVIPIAVSLPEGTYVLRAYTDNLQNLGSDYFFHRNIEILSPFSAKYMLQSSLEQNGERLKVKLNLFDKTKEKPVYPNVFNVHLNNQPSEQFISNKKGEALIILSSSPGENKRVLAVETAQYQKFYVVPGPDNEFDVSFYPEGGYLLNGVLCRVAFKALYRDGSPVNITAEIVDEENNQYGTTTTLHEGMGAFNIRSESGKKYFLACKDAYGNSKRFEIPEAQENFYSLHLEEESGDLKVSVRCTDNQTPKSGLQLILHTRGMLHYAAQWDTIYNTLSVNTSTFPPGIMQVLLLDSLANPLSERLYFCNNHDNAYLNFQTDGENYDARSLVKAELNLLDKNGNPLSGSFSVSITDNQDILPDSTTDIRSSLLLDSELKGFITNPTFYMKEGNKEALDLLMLTHGWRRYSIPDIIRRKYTQPIFPNRQSMEISGSVRKGLLGKPLNNKEVSVFSWGADYLEETTTDSSGQFLFNGFEAHDSLTFVVQTSSKNRYSIEVTVDEEQFPVVSEHLFKPNLGKTETPRDYSYQSYLVKKSNTRYTMENGMRKIELGEIEVTAKRKENTKEESYSYYMPKTNLDVLDSKELEEIQPASLSDAIIHMPFLQIKEDADGNKKVYIDRMNYKLPTSEGSTLPATLVIDDIIYDDYDLDNMIDPFNIERIGVLKGTAASILGGSGAGGAVVITTKKGMSKDAIPSAINNIKKIKPLGFQQPVEFYSPKYETKAQREREEPDFRTTVYWNPNINVPKSGKAEFDFYTADIRTSYSAIIEGVTNEGRIVRGEYTIERK